MSMRSQTVVVRLADGSHRQINLAKDHGPDAWPVCVDPRARRCQTVVPGTVRAVA